MTANHDSNGPEEQLTRALDGYLLALAQHGAADLEGWAGTLPLGEMRDRFRREALAEEYAWRVSRGEAVTLESFLARLPRAVDRKAFQNIVRANQLAGRTLPAQLAPGVMLANRYRILAPLGRGGMSVVFAASDTELGREVAIKVFNAQGQAGTAEEWESIAHAEAAALARLDSPNLVRVLDIRRDKAHSYIVMDLVRGLDLSKVLDELVREEKAGAPPARRPERLRALLERSRDATPEEEARALVDRIDDRSWPRTVARILATVAEAIGLAHGQGLVHRDLKPNNVVLRPGGDPVVLDFGLSAPVRPLGEDSGALRGTPEYFAPEQARNLRSGSDVRTDTYQLGLVLYELLSFERAQSRGETEDVLSFLARVSAGPARQVAALGSAVPRSLRAICAKALAAKPEERYATAAQMAEDLRRFVRGLPNVHASTGFVHGAALRAGWAARRPAFAALVLGVAALGLGAYMRAEAANRWSPPALSTFHFQRGWSTVQPIGTVEAVEMSPASERELLGVSIEAPSDTWVYAAAITGGGPNGLSFLPLRPRRLNSSEEPAQWFQFVKEGSRAEFECWWFDGADPEEGVLFMARAERSPDIELWFDQLERQRIERTLPVAYADAMRTFEALAGPARGGYTPDQIPTEERLEVFRNLVPRQGAQQDVSKDGRMKWIQQVLQVRKKS